MKVIIDENLSPALAKALSALFAGEHVVEHIRGKFGTGVKDADWIRKLSEEGHWIVISGDARIAKSKAEQAAFRNSRLIGFFLAPALNGAPSSCAPASSQRPTSKRELISCLSVLLLHLLKWRVSLASAAQVGKRAS